MTHSDPLFWFPRTKVRPPVSSADLFDRPFLLDRIYQAVMSRRLTLLSAPPGYGKTTLLAALPQAFPHLPVAWLSLDDEDNDPQRLGALLLAALHEIFPDFGAPLQALLAEGPPEWRRFAGLLVNTLLDLDPAPFVLVIDDLHLLREPALLEALDYLIARLPPAMHIAATTRYEPRLALARLRAQGHLAEFRLDELRFTPDEMAFWLNDRLGFDLAPDDLAQLHHQTEGWAAAVRLVALSLGRRTGRAAVLTGLGHSHRFIFDYLLEEVLRQQEPALRTFLLETSILPELTPALCQAVTGRADAHRLLETAYRRNLFLTLNEAGTDVGGAPHATPVYRYHDLFALFLQEQLAQSQPDRIVELQRRAAEAQPDPMRAIRHYLAAALWPQAARAIEAVGRERLEHGYLGQVCRWIGFMPETEHRQYPWLQLFLGADAVRRGQYEEAQAYLERARQGFAGADDSTGEAEALVQLGEVFTCLAQPQPADAVLAQALDYPLAAAKRTKVQINRAWIAFYTGDWPGMDAHLRTTLQEVLYGGDPGACQSLLLSLGPQFIYGSDGAGPVERLCLNALERYGDEGGLIQAAAHAYLGYLTWAQGKVEEARRHAAAAQALCRQLGGAAHLELYIDHVLLFDALRRGAYDEFAAALAESLARTETVLTYRQWWAAYRYLEAYALRWQDRRGEIRPIWQAVAATAIAYELPEGAIARDLLEALSAWNEDPEGAEVALMRAAATQDRVQHACIATHARVALAELSLARGCSAEALAWFAPVLETLARHRLPGVLLQESPTVLPLLRLAEAQGIQPEFVRRVRTLLPEPAPPAAADGDLGRRSSQASLPIPGEVESLSPREVEVLHLLAEGLDNRAIAARLVIAPGTVKRHTINIYGKLRVHSRTQAVARARALHLL